MGSEAITFHLFDYFSKVIATAKSLLKHKVKLLYANLAL